jgi:hypothetical protein
VLLYDRIFTVLLYDRSVGVKERGITQVTLFSVKSELGEKLAILTLNYSFLCRKRIK